jgi:hypothetical protein
MHCLPKNVYFSLKTKDWKFRVRCHEGCGTNDTGVRNVDSFKGNGTRTCDEPGKPLGLVVVFGLLPSASHGDCGTVEPRRPRPRGTLRLEGVHPSGGQLSGDGEHLVLCSLLYETCDATLWCAVGRGGQPSACVCK